MASDVQRISTVTVPREIHKRWAFRARGLVGGLAVAGFGGAALLSRPHFPPESSGVVICNALGWVLFAAGALLRFWATLYIGGRKLHTLASDGPYSIVRNPLYLGTFLIWSAGAVYFQSLTLLVGVLVGIAFYRWFAIPGEEAQLRAMLGAPYEQYCREVPRLLPAWSRFHSPESTPVRIHGLWLECRRASRWVWLPIFAEWVNHLRMESWWPQVWTLP